MKNKVISIFIVLVLTLNICISFAYATDINNELVLEPEVSDDENNNENIIIEDNNKDEKPEEEKNEVEEKQVEIEDKKEEKQDETNEVTEVVSGSAAGCTIAGENISLGFNHTAKTTDRVNVRQEANTSSRVFITAPLNATVTILNLEKENNFYQVKYVEKSNTYYGYMHSDYLKLDSNIKIEVGQTYALTATLEPADADEAPMFESLNTSIAEVSSKGVITGIKPGVVIVKGYIHAGLSDYAVVEVKSDKKIPATAISFGYSHTGKTTTKVYMRKSATNKSKKLILLKSGKTVTITAKNITNGYYKVKYKSGTKTYSGYIYNKSMKRNSNITVVATHTKKLYPSLSPSDTTDKVKYTSSDTTLATVDDTGKITAKKVGTVLITGKTDSGKSDYVVVYVKKYIPVSSISLKERSYVKVGKTATLKRTILPTNTTEKITWRSENTDIATVDKDGVVTGKKAGLVNILASEPSGLIAQTVLHVAEPDTLSLNQRASAIASHYPHVDRIIYGSSVLGEPLEAYEIRGNGTNEHVIFIEAAVHGYEDEYAKDGKVLTSLANGLIDYYATNPDKLKDYTLVIVPSANPDGALYGKNNQRANGKNPFGRCTYKGIDMNRDFRDGLFKAQESRALRDLLYYTYGTRLRVHMDLHGWENSVIGDRDIVNIVRNSTGIKTDKSDRYGEANAYIISYTKFTLGAHAALVEFPNSKSVNESKFESALNKIMNSSLFLPE